MPEIAPPSSGRALKVFGIALIALGGLIYAAAGGVDGDNPLIFVGVIPKIAGIFVNGVVWHAGSRFGR